MERIGIIVALDTVGSIMLFEKIIGLILVVLKNLAAGVWNCCLEALLNTPFGKILRKGDDLAACIIIGFEVGIIVALFWYN